MATDDPDPSTANCRSLLESMLDRVQRDEPVDDEVVGSNLDPRRLVELLGPPARAKAEIDWLVVNGERVDATLTAGDEQWRVVFGCASATAIDWIDVFERPAHFDGIAGGHAIVVNGPSGAGKSIVMQALQQVADGPLIVFDEPEHIGTVRPEFLIWRDRVPTLHRGYLDAIAALARAGNQVAVSAAGHRQSEFVDAFTDVPTLAVGLSCELDVLLRRERRTGRWGGIAAGSLDVHDGWTYDLEFDTTDDPDPMEIARQVLRRVERSVPLDPRQAAPGTQEVGRGTTRDTLTMVTIRVARQDDLDQVVALWETAAGPTTLPCGIEEVRRLVDRDAEALLVADASSDDDASEIVGTLIVGWDGWRCHMYRMTVRPDHRRGRVATDLVDAAHRRAEALGAERLDAIVDLDNPGGIAFWESIAFTRKLNNGRWVSTERSGSR